MSRKRPATATLTIQEQQRFLESNNKRKMLLTHIRTSLAHKKTAADNKQNTLQQNQNSSTKEEKKKRKDETPASFSAIATNNIYAQLITASDSEEEEETSNTAAASSSTDMSLTLWTNTGSSQPAAVLDQDLKIITEERQLQKQAATASLSTSSVLHHPLFQPKAQQQDEMEVRVIDRLDQMDAAITEIKSNKVCTASLQHQHQRDIVLASPSHPPSVFVTCCCMIISC